MIFGVIRVINFALGELVMLGMHATILVGVTLATVVAALLLAGLGCGLQRFVISKVSGSRVIGRHNEGYFAQLILTLGLSQVLPKWH